MAGEQRTVAVIGLGRMGAAMAGTLHRAGVPLILWNRSPEKAEALAVELGAEAAATPEDAARKADVVLSSLADDAAVREVYLGEHGVLRGLDGGSLVLETSTIDPETVDEVGAAVDSTGAGMLDCPVSGSVSLVEAGSLTIMAGGDPSLLEAADVALGPLSAKVFHVGPRGAGAAMKLAVNGLVHAINIALSEALVLAERAGVPREAAYDVFAAGAGGAPFVAYKRAAFLDPDATPVAFSLDLVAKDLDLITGLGRRSGVGMAQAEAGRELVEQIIAAGFGPKDMSAVAEYLRS